MQGAGKQQERQHPVHQQVVEIDLAHQALHPLFQPRVADDTQALEQQGKQQGSDHDANGGRQADKAVIQVGEEGGQANKRSNELKHSGSCSGFQFGTRVHRAVLGWLAVGLGTQFLTACVDRDRWVSFPWQAIVRDARRGEMLR
ncbi:hypothetical protein D3C77_581440 [compost metagenome]